MSSRKTSKWPYIIGGIILILILAYFLGPKPAKPDFAKLHYPHLTRDISMIGDSIINNEQNFQLKPGNDARIFWIKQFEKTPVAFVYLHGTGASPVEGDPIHEGLAYRYGANMFIQRLADHGLQDMEPLSHITAQEWLQSALNAIAVGHVLGDKVYVISCSTGSTLAMALAAHYPELIDGLIMFSPNVDVYDKRSSILVKPWGLQMARNVMHSKNYSWDAPGKARPYWYTTYRLEGLTVLKTMINATMTEETFKAIKQPVFMAYYYKDEEHQDKIVSVARMKEMFQQLGTPADQKREAAIDDAGTHVITSDLFNPYLDSVWEPTISFCEEVLHLPVINDGDWRLWSNNDPQKQ